MKTIFERKSLLAIESHKSGAGADICVMFIPRERFPRYRRPLRGRSEPRLADHHGSNVDRGSAPRETKMLQSSRYLPNNCTVFEPVNDRTGYVAVVPAASGTITIDRLS